MSLYIIYLNYPLSKLVNYSNAYWNVLIKTYRKGNVFNSFTLIKIVLLILTTYFFQIAMLLKLIFNFML